MIEFIAGFVSASAVWFVLQRRHDARVDREIEARKMAFDQERVRRIFDKHPKEGAFIRAAEWIDDDAEGSSDG